MNSKSLGILSAVTASICCIGPFVLIVLGLGGLGVGAVIGKFHWHFILAAIIFLGFAWRSYFKEKNACDAKQCTMEGKNITKTILTLASVIVLVFAGANVYTYAKGGASKDVIQTGTQMNIPVEGMTCLTCEVSVNSAVKKLSGIYEVRANAKDQLVRVAYDSGKTSLDEIIAAINGTGFKAQKPKV